VAILVTGMSDPLPLNRGQLLALLSAVAREFGGGLRAVSHELRRWRRLAERIPDSPLRTDALHAIKHKRGHTDGAALFWTLPSRRDKRLLRALVTYELIQDYLDCATERGMAIGADSGAQLYRAIGDAVDPSRPLADYYRDHPWRDDGGYLASLVQAFRNDSTQLPSFDVIRPHMDREAARTWVLDTNHAIDPVRRDHALRTWAATEFPAERNLRWYELTAAASGWITAHALLAVGAEPGATRHDVDTTYSAYFPWYALSLTMLDGYVDQADDLTTGNHSYFHHYRDSDDGINRLCNSLERSADSVLGLRHGERHAVLLGCMIALYLSKDSARTDAMRPSTRQIARAGGTLPRMLLPVLRLWRIANAQRAST
jgi:tetraprenyl-beta-curcumene synthase